MLNPATTNTPPPPAPPPTVLAEVLVLEHEHAANGRDADHRVAVSATGAVRVDDGDRRDVDVGLGEHVAVVHHILSQDSEAIHLDGNQRRPLPAAGHVRQIQSVIQQETGSIPDNCRRRHPRRRLSEGGSNSVPCRFPVQTGLARGR